MALLLDSIDLDEIRATMDLGVFAGVTTNPKLLAGLPRSEHLERLGEIARTCPGSGCVGRKGGSDQGRQVRARQGR